MLEVGAIVGGKFRIERVLGEGGMGLVAVATHLQLDQPVALKVVRDPMLGNTEVIERFLREARASARLRSDHVCKVSDVGQLDDGAPYLVMELLEGADLAHVIAASPLQVATAADYVLQACVAVAEAHAAGIIHRDLKPANLFLTRRFDGTPLIKVLDFGIATAPAATDVKITKTSTVMGSPGYMSPEQLRSMRDVDARSDVWALGVILYELVTGHLPFRGESVTEMTVKIVIDPPEPLPFDAPVFAAIVIKCLEKQVELRYQSVAELAADLAPLAGEAGPRTATLVSSIHQAQPLPRVGTAPIAAPVVTNAPTQATGPIAAGVRPATQPPPMPVAGVVVASAAMPVAMPAARGAFATAPTQLGVAPPVEVRATTTLQAAASQATGAIVAPPRARRRVALAIGLVVGAALGAGGVVFALRGPERPNRHRYTPVAAAPPAIDAAPPLTSPAPPLDAGAVAIATPALDAAVEVAPPPAPPVKPPVHTAPTAPPHKPAPPPVIKHPAPPPTTATNTQADDDGPAADPPEPGAQLASAKAALDAKEPEKALSIAQDVVKHHPQNKGAIRAAVAIGVTAACRLKRDKAAHDLFMKLPQRARFEARKLRDQCEEQGVVID